MHKNLMERFYDRVLIHTDELEVEVNGYTADFFQLADGEKFTDQAQIDKILLLDALFNAAYDLGVIDTAFPESEEEGQ